MNINLDDIFVVSFSYIHENGEIVTGELVVFGRDNALKMSQDEWNRLKNMDYAHVVTKPATLSWSNVLVEDVYAEPIFNRETEYEDSCGDDFWDADEEYELAE